MSSSLHTAPHSSEPSVCPADSKFSASSSPTASSQSPSSLLSMESSAANSTTLATAPSLTTTNTTSDLTRVGVHSHGSSPSPPVITPPTHTGASLHSVSPSLFPTQAMYFNNSHTGGAGNSNSIRPSETLSYQASATANISRGATSAHSASRWQSSHSSHAQPGGFSPRSSASCHSSSSAAAASFSSSTLSSSAAVAASSSAPDTSTISSSRPSTNISSPQQHSASDSAHIDTQPHTSSEQYRQQTHFYPAPNQKYFMPIFPAQQQQSVAVYRAPFNVQHASTTAVASASNDAGLKTEPQLHYEQPARLQEQQQSREQVQQQPQNQVRLLSGVERTGAHSSTRADTAHATEYTRLSGNAKDKDKDTSGSRVSPNREHSLFSASASDSSAAFSHGALRTQADAMMSGSAASAASSSSTAHHPARPGDIIATAPYSQPTSSHEPSNGPQPGSPSRQLSLLRCIPGDATVQSTQLAMHSMDTPEIGPQTTVVSWSSRPQSAQLASSGSVLLPDYLVPTSHDGSLLDASGVVTTTAAPHHLQSSLPAGSNVYSASHEMLSQPGTIDSIHQSSSSVANLSSTFGSGSTSSSNSRKSISSGSSSSSGSGSNSNSNSNSSSNSSSSSNSTPTRTSQPKVRRREGLCTNCEATESPMWRSGPAGRGTLCNACGLMYARIRRQCMTAGTSPTEAALRRMAGMRKRKKANTAKKRARAASAEQDHSRSAQGSPAPSAHSPDSSDCDNSLQSSKKRKKHRHKHKSERRKHRSKNKRERKRTREAEAQLYHLAQSTQGLLAGVSSLPSPQQQQQQQ
eukprot:CAMPEP_0177665920 /NCGR_PEP_ID=MMETSP0447-20121125/21309_1 /TAXON_ID=0 /ORGANISM="Stygamoeba regulata, Strain BSH-02190019" /LENGTH=803 /DNA_ID=CAMNT_0019172041 /DNA_START=32 /DNA_END=2440 /DNA_ORIENTATION=+